MSIDVKKAYDVTRMQEDIQSISALLKSKDVINQAPYDSDCDLVKTYTSKGKVFLRSLIEDSVLQIRELKDKNEFSSKLGVSTQPPEPKYHPYVWADGLWSENYFTVAVSANCDERKKEGFEFGAVLDVVEDKISDNRETEVRTNLKDLKGRLADSCVFSGEGSVEIAWRSHETPKFPGNKDEIFPKIVISLFNNTGDSPREDYQCLVNELTMALVVIKAMYRFVCASTDDVRDSIFSKVVRLLKLSQKIKVEAYDPGPTFYRIQDLLFDDCKQLVLTGAPGTGKSYTAKEYVKWQLYCDYDGEKDAFDKEWKDPKSDINKKWAMVQFHPSFDYTDFVEGLRPINIGSSNKPQTTFVRIDGAFKEFCRWVEIENKKESENVDSSNSDDGGTTGSDYRGLKKDFYYFIIDEINRADLSKVFGELMYCLEDGYRGPENRIKTQYSNLKTYEYNKRKKVIPITNDVFSDGFYIPENVIIIGTMNDIDRGVDTFDFALRRRFRWVSVDVNDQLLMSTFYSMNKKYGSRVEEGDMFNLVGRIDQMNAVLGEEDSEWSRVFRPAKDYYVGPAYFESYFKNGESLDNIWSNKIAPLLREYVRGQDYVEEFLSKCYEGLIHYEKEVSYVSPIFKDLDLLLNQNENVSSTGKGFFKNPKNQIEDNLKVEKIVEIAKNGLRSNEKKKKVDDELMPKVQELLGLYN
ncbi:MAG: AAA family ATPase [Clostridiales bacterium]|nr:AAA family ATPase [Clostridiales bacterium]